MSNLMYLFINGVLSPPSNTPPVTTLLESHHGAYTTFRTHNNGLQLLFWERHLKRLANSAKILSDSCPRLLFKPGQNQNPISLPQIRTLKWDLMVRSIVNDSMKAALSIVLQERKGGTELAFTALVSGNLEKLIPNEKRVDEEEDISRVFDVYLHVGFYAPLVFGGNGAHLAVVGKGRDVAAAKYSDWVRIRKPLEKLRPPSATELMLSNDGDQILEGCLTNFFVVCRRHSIEDDAYESKETELSESKRGCSFELQTAPISDGVLPGVVREVVMEVCLRNGIPVQEVAPSWSKRDLWEEAFITNGLRLLQHVERIRFPRWWASRESGTWKEVTWEEKRFEGPGSVTLQIQEEVLERAMLEGYPIASLTSNGINL